ncbi:MAG: aquaporin [Flavobacteriales bacterium]|nr:aquaporin [Flavobacteriales bacterium]
MKKLIAEALGTFAIVFFGTGSIAVNTDSGGALGTLGIAIAFGSIVAIMIMVFGRTSGAHFNPAVSLALASTGKFPWKELPSYILSQVGGAIAASALLWFTGMGDHGLGTTQPAGTEWQAFLIEFVITFFLMLTICGVGESGKPFHAAMAIGIAVMLGALFAGPVCGASMNPARSIGPAIISGHTGHLWIYLLAPTAGAIAAVQLWRLRGFESNN